MKLYCDKILCMYEKLYALWALFGVRIVQDAIPIPLWPFSGLATPHYYQGFTYYDTEYIVKLEK